MQRRRGRREKEMIRVISLRPLRHCVTHELRMVEVENQRKAGIFELQDSRLSRLRAGISLSNGKRSHLHSDICICPLPSACKCTFHRPS